MPASIKKSTLLGIPFLLLLVFAILETFACSMCKVTINGKTYLGNNEDSWRLGTRVIFERGSTGKLGALYVAYENDFPQGGMNEAGLSFDGLSLWPKLFKPDPKKKNITDNTLFVKQIMQTCKTVDDVKQFAIKYNRNSLSNCELLFADKSGSYLVMEPDTMISGNDDKYIIANFCPSSTTETERLHWDRYKRGRIFINNHLGDTSEHYCLDLVDTMHECRKGLGDGTMYSFVADLENGVFDLYFYHDFKHATRFNLKEELAKGDHVLSMPSLFPPNREYEKLLNYKTPHNSLTLRSLIFLGGGLFLFSAFFFFMSFFWNWYKKQNASCLKLGLFGLSTIMAYYMYCLITNKAVYYSKAPFRDYRFSMQNIAAYIPFLLLILVIPLFKINFELYKKTTWKWYSKFLFTVNNVIYLGLIGLFAYWGFYNVF